MGPTKELIRRLFGYMEWADDAMVEASRTVPDREYFLPRGFSHGSIHGLLVHGMAAQDVWLRRWHGDGDAAVADARSFPTRGGLLRRWAEVHAELVSFLDRQTDETLLIPVVARNTYGEAFELPLGETMVHVVDHATYHRGQINAMIAMAGGTPVAAYYQRYLALKGS